MSATDQLKSVLCDPEGKCCIAGSDEDRAIVDRALEALAKPPLPVQEPTDKQIEAAIDAWFKSSIVDESYQSRMRAAFAAAHIGAKP